jgi:surface carbohydrate biosynthesis protein
MPDPKPLLLIPVENQVRELDPKLLLACVAAEHGFSSVIGSRREMEFNIDAFPRSIYLSKSMTIRSLLFFRVAKKFGHYIITWDEEALVHLPPETYFSRRLDPKTIRYVSHLFAWGPDNAELWRQYPKLPGETPIHITGNPRSDMLRPEMRAFYEKEVAELWQAYGNFILVNTNFNHVNAFGPDMNLFQPVKRTAQRPKFGRAARGMTREYAEGLRDHKTAIFEDFQQLIPALDREFPDYSIVVRPHPTENLDVYRRLAAQCERVRVTNEGNVVPWLMAAKALIHNSCTTGVEAYVMGLPAISYRATVNENYDYGFYRLPNLISHQCFNFEELRETLRKILAGELGVADGNERKALLDHYLAAQDGPLACERIVDALEQFTENREEAVKQSIPKRLERWLVSKGLHLVKRLKSKIPGSHNRPEFQRHRYPEISLEEVSARISRFQKLLGESGELKVEQIFNMFFRISS